MADAEEPKPEQKAEQAREEAQAQLGEPPKLRQLEPGELKRILAEHKTWLESQEYVSWAKAKSQEEKAYYEEGRPDIAGCILKKVDLRFRDLRGAKLSNKFLGGSKLNLEGSSDLEGAELIGANLQGALLRGVNLQETDLEDANLEQADLCYANVKGATLSRADLSDAALSHVKGLEGARLRDVNFGRATGLTGKEFAGSDITGANLPEGIRDFKILEVVEETAKSARKLFVAMILGCVYAWLTIATTTDARLLTNSASSPLPIIQTEIPIAGFFWAAPVILLAIYIWFHLYLQEMWKRLAGLPAIFPDGKPLDEKVYPWLLTGLVRPHFKLLRENRPPLSRVKVGISILLAWWVVPFTFALFWLRYLPRHDYSGTILQIGLLVVIICCAIWFQYLARKTLRGEMPEPTEPDPLKHTYWDEVTVTPATFLLLLTWYVSAGAIEGNREDYVPRLLDTVAWGAFADLREANVSTRPENWFVARAKDTKGKEVKELNIVNGAQLRGADLRNASAQGAFLAKANLREARLQGANLEGAKLEQASLGDAKLQGANLQGSQLQGANLEWAILESADLTGAQLQGTDLKHAHLEWASLLEANLQSSDLSSAHLKEAILFGADLRNVVGLSETEVQMACTTEETKLPTALQLATRCTESQMERVSKILTHATAMIRIRDYR